LEKDALFLWKYKRFFVDLPYGVKGIGEEREM
jgi:hypothetical protein